MKRRKCEVRAHDGKSRYDGWFHTWTRIKGEVRAVVEDSAGNVYYEDPSHLKFTEGVKV